MTPLQFAKENCANYQTNGSCLGMGIRDDLSQYSFGKKPRCVLANNQPCQYFEECVLPVGSDKTTARGVVLATHRDEAAKLYRLTSGSLTVSALSKRLCPECNKRPLEPYKRLCYECRASKRLASDRNQKRKQRVERPTDVDFEALETKDLQ